MNADLANPEDLAELRAILCSGEHRPALGWSAVHAFEAEQGIVLPEPYRTFVAEISDGTEAGPPAYGLLPMAEDPGDWADWDGGRDLARPFPATQAAQFEDDEEEWDDDIVEPYFNHGSVVLGTDGCAMYWLLIVTGPSRGHIWNIDEYGATPFGAEFGHSTGESGFVGWVKHWSAKMAGPDYKTQGNWFEAKH